MRTTALILALAMAAPAWAQADKSAEKPADEMAKPEAPKPKAPSKHSKRMEDARHCLDKPSNTEIIKCAEAYL